MSQCGICIALLFDAIYLTYPLKMPSDTTIEPTATITYKINPLPIEFDLYSPIVRSNTPGALIIHYHPGATYLGSKKHRGPFVAQPPHFPQECKLNLRSSCALPVALRTLVESTLFEIMDRELRRVKCSRDCALHLDERTSHAIVRSAQ
jgi:hypothetical protein